MTREGTGFGMDDFGAAPFGEARWSHRLLWEDIPQYDRILDERVDGSLFKLVQTLGDVFNLSRREIKKLFELRDARVLRTRWDTPIEVSGVYDFTSAGGSSDGRAYVTVHVLDPAALKPVSPAWSVDDGLVQYQIRAIRKAEGQVEFYADSLPLGPSSAPLVAMSGVAPVTLRPNPLLQHLAADYGASFDGHEPERNQRSSVYDYHKLLPLKGSLEGLVVRAAMSGMDIQVYSMYRVPASIETLVGPDHFFEVPTGSGNFYTDVPPTVPLYDAIPADVIPADLIGDCSSISIPSAVTSVSGSPGDWTATLSSQSPAASSYWYFTSDAQPKTRFYAEHDTSLAPHEVKIVSQSPPPVGDIVWRFYCPIVTNCDWCKSYKVLVDLTVVDPTILASPRSLELAFQRARTKIESMLPAHVEVARYTFSP